MITGIRCLKILRFPVHNEGTKLLEGVFTAAVPKSVVFHHLPLGGKTT
jgi:hypothetical protein